MSALAVGQSEDAFRFDWGIEGLRAIVPGARVVIVIDVLTFTTAVDLTLTNGQSMPGSPLCLAGQSNDTTVLAGCLRNASAVAAAARQIAGPDGAIALVSTGDLWESGGAVRHATEDLLGAGAILAALDPSAAVSPPRCSPEAAAARAAYVGARFRMVEHIARTASGRELISRGWVDGVGIAATIDASRIVPMLRDGVFIASR